MLNGDSAATYSPRRHESPFYHYYAHHHHYSVIIVAFRHYSQLHSIFLLARIIFSRHGIRKSDIQYEYRFTSHHRPPGDTMRAIVSAIWYCHYARDVVFHTLSSLLHTRHDISLLVIISATGGRGERLGVKEKQRQKERCAGH